MEIFKKYEGPPLRKGDYGYEWNQSSRIDSVQLAKDAGQRAGEIRREIGLDKVMPRSEEGRKENRI